jgi:integrase
VRAKLIVHNPMEGIPAPREQQRTPTFLERDELLRFLDAAKGDPYEVFYVVAVTSGLRLGELGGLRWRDVDFRRAQIQVERQLDDRTREIAPLKTEHSRRAVPLPKVALDALRAHRDRIGAIPHGDRLVFLSPEETPIRASNLRRRSFKPILKRAGLAEKNLRLHDLRHTMATLLADQGAPLTAIQRRLGHGSVAVTAKIYTHLSDRGAREAANLLDAVLGAD